MPRQSPAASAPPDKQPAPPGFGWRIPLLLLLGIAAFGGTFLAVRHANRPPAGMVWIPGGEFTMGTDGDVGWADEKPAHRVRVHEPSAAQIVRGLHMMDARAMHTARRHQLPGVVAMRATDDDDYVAFARKLHGGRLSLLRRATNGVHEPHFRTRKSLPHQTYKAQHFLNGLRRLGGDAKTRALLQRQHVLLRQDDVKLFQIAS